jgi:hypothetical protein
MNVFVGWGEDERSIPQLLFDHIERVEYLLHFIIAQESNMSETPNMRS